MNIFKAGWTLFKLKQVKGQPVTASYGDIASQIAKAVAYTGATLLASHGAIEHQDEESLRPMVELLTAGILYVMPVIVSFVQSKARAVQEINTADVGRSMPAAAPIAAIRQLSQEETKSNLAAPTPDMMQKDPKAV